MKVERWGQDELQVWTHPRDDRDKKWVIVSPSELVEEQNKWDMYESSLPSTQR